MRHAKKEKKKVKVIAKVYKANKVAVAIVKEKKARVKKKDTYFKAHKLTAEERKARRAANLAIDL